MVATMSKTFRDWLSKKLVDSNPDIDLDVFVSYIEGILEDDTSKDEKIESLNELLPSVLEDGTSEFCDSIMKQWDEKASVVEEETVSVDDKLASIMEKQKLSVATKREISAEQNAQKEAILAQYSTVCDGDEEIIDDDDDGATYKGATYDGPTVMKNANADKVFQEQREKREKMKADSDHKKERDKSDREKQKQAKVDRKEKEKQRTQKGERRR
ncbi:coiled-coil domain-containing protein 43-like [Lineus longissimus]|uniref:coiled-coil domain-containing protein 43-like n=1 Tax=Lineus longissimus TaxID=88925 RepID=UPI002B4E6702